MADNYKSNQAQLGTSATAFIQAQNVAGGGCQIPSIFFENVHATATALLSVYYNGTTDPTKIFKASLAPGESFEWTNMIVLEQNEALNMKSDTASAINAFASYLDYP